MKLEQVFTAKASESAVRERATAYLVGAGYKPSPGRGGEGLIFRRGSLVGSYASFNPKGWRAVAVVEATPDEEVWGTQVYAALEVDTSGQIVTAREEQFWEAEMSGLVAAVTGQGLLPGERDAARDAAGAARRQNLVALSGMVAIGVVLALLAFLVLGPLPFGATHVIISLVLFIGLGILARRRKREL